MENLLIQETFNKSMHEIPYILMGSLRFLILFLCRHHHKSPNHINILTLLVEYLIENLVQLVVSIYTNICLLALKTS